MSAPVYAPPLGVSPPLLELRSPPGYWLFLGLLTSGSALGTAAFSWQLLVQPDVPTFFFTALAALFTTGLALCTWLVYWRRLQVHDWGVAVRGILADTAVPWQEIAVVRAPAALAAGANLVGGTSFRTTRGKRFGVRGYGAKGAKAAEVVMAKVIPRLADEIVQRLKAGGSQSFGRLTASWEGLSHKGSQVRWQEIENANFSPEGFRIFPRNRPEATIVLPLATENLHVFFGVWKRRLAEVSPAEAAAAPTAPPVGASGVERVKGFPDVDPELGPVVCGKGRGIGLELTLLALAVLSLLAALAGFALGADTLGLGITAGIVGAVFLLAWWAVRGNPFAVYEKGLRKGKRTVRWEETADLTYAVTDQYHNGAYVGRMIGLTLAGPGGAIRLGGRGAKMEGMCTTILDRQLPPLLERRFREIEAGGAVTVDKLSLKKSGLAWKGEEVAWSGLHSWEVRKGFLHVWRKGQEKSWAILPMNGKNSRLVLPLLERLVRHVG